MTVSIVVLRYKNESYNCSCVIYRQIKDKDSHYYTGRYGKIKKKEMRRFHLKHSTPRSFDKNFVLLVIKLNLLSIIENLNS